MGRATSSRKKTAPARKERKGKPEARKAGGGTPPDLIMDDVGPAETEAREPGARIELPSSGLAEDILARADAQGIPALPAESPGAPVPLPVQPAHSLSFFTVPAREEKKVVEATEHLVTFMLGHEEYGLDVRLVQEIIRITETTPVPRAPEFVKGVINLRGRIIPVVDLKRKLSLGEVDGASRLARIVVVKLRERLVGLLVDGASQVLKIPVSTIEPAPEEVVEINENYIRGVAKLRDRLIILMDLSQILLLEGREVGTQAIPA